MINLVRLFVALGCATVLCTTVSSAESESIEIEIGGGPNAGMYTLPSADIYCMHVKGQNIVAASYKDFDASDVKKVGEAAIGVTNPDDAGPKRGSVQVSFGAGDDKAGPKYFISIPNDSPGPLTLARSGKSAELTFQGKTKDGVSIRITAKCPELEEL